MKFPSETDFRVLVLKIGMHWEIVVFADYRGVTIATRNEVSGSKFKAEKWKRIYSSYNSEEMSRFFDDWKQTKFKISDL